MPYVGLHPRHPLHLLISKILLKHFNLALGFGFKQNPIPHSFCYFRDTILGWPPPSRSTPDSDPPLENPEAASVYELHMYVCIEIAFHVTECKLSVILEIKMPIVKNQSLKLVGTYLQSSCDQPKVYYM